MRKLAMTMLMLLPGMALGQTADEERDRGILQAFIEDNLSSAGREVRIDGFSGALSSRATLERLSISDDDGVWLVLEGAALDWTRSAVLRGRLEINELSAEKLILTRLPKTAPDAPTPEAPGFVFALPELPVSINLAKLEITRAEFGPDLLGQAVALSLSGAASLADGAGTVELGINRLDGPEGRITVSGNYANATQDLTLALDFREEAGGIAAGLLNLPDEPAVELVLEGDGTLDAFTGRLRLATDGAERIAGTITLGALPVTGDAPPDRRFGADIDGDLAPLLAPEYREFVGESITLDVAGILHGDGELDLERLEVQTGSVMLTGALSLGPDKWPSRIAVSGQIAAPDGGEVLLAIPGPKTWIERVDLTVNYDAAAGNGWQAETVITGLRRDDVSVSRAALSGSGALRRGEGVEIGMVSGDVTLDIAGIALDDPTLATTVGTTLAGTVNFAYNEAQPLELSDFALTSGDVELAGDATVSGFWAGGSPTIDGAVTLKTGELSRFAPISGLDLVGTGELALSGRIEPLGGAFDLELAGTTGDLGIGNTFLDPLITGAGTIDAALRRSAAGMALDRFEIVTPATELTASGALATGAADLRFSLAVADASVVDPSLSGAARASGTAVQTEETWTIATQVEAPGGASATVDGSVVIGETGIGAVNGIAEIAATSLAPYSALAGRALSGGLNVTLAGAGNLTTGTLEASVMGMARDLVVGIDAVDKLMAGEADLTVDLARGADGVLTVRTGLFETPQGGATVAGTIGGDGAQLDFDVSLVDVALYLPDLSGRATARGNVMQSGSDWQIVADLSAPGGAAGTLRGAVTVTDGVPGLMAVAGTVTADDLAPYSVLAGRRLGGAVSLGLNATGDLRDLTGRADVSGTARDLAVEVDLADRLLAGQTTLAITAARTADGMITVETGRITNPQLTADLSGTISGDSGRLAFDAALTDAGLVVAPLSGATSARGVVTRAGDILQIESRLTAPGDTTGTVAGSLSLEGGVPGLVTGTARIGVARLSAFSALAGRDLDGAVSFDLTADGDLRDLTGSAEVTANGLDLSFGIDAADRALAGESVLAVTAARDASGKITIDTGTFQTDAATAEVAGSLGGDGARLVFDLGVPDMAALADRISGAATLRGVVTQTGDDWRLQAGLSAPGGVAGTIDTTVALTDSGPGAAQLALELSADRLGPYSRLVGQQLAGGLTLTAQAEGNLGTLTGTADIDGTTANLRTGLVAADKLLTGNGTLKLSVERMADGTLVFRRARATTPQLSAELTGRYGGGAGSAATYDLRLSNLGLFATGFNGPATAQGTVRAEGTNLRVNAGLTGPGGVTARVGGTVASTFNRAALAITGGAPLAVVNTFIAPNLVSGTASFDLSLNGPLELASLSGTVRTEGAALALPSVPLRLVNLNADVSLSRGRAQVAVITEVSTGGRLMVNGPIDLSAPFNATLAVDVENFRALDPGLYETILNGRINVTGALTGGATIAGALRLGDVELRIPDGGGLTRVSLPGLIHEHEPNRVLRTRIRAGLVDTGNSGGNGGGGRSVAYPLDLTVTAPNRIFIRGRGLDAEMGGALRLTGTTADVVTQGGFELVRGRLDILGERLVLSEGSVQMQGDFDPFIRMVAATNSGGAAIRIVIEGFASAPELTISSVPDLPAEDVLARLIFKRGLGEITPFQAVQLGLAVRTLTGGGGDGILDRLRNGFGLDDLDVTTNDGGNAEVRLGTYVTDNIYTGVAVDATGRSEINLNLQVTPNITARGSVSSDGQTGLGLFFERDY